MQWVTAVGGEATKESGVTRQGLNTQVQAGGSISVLPTEAPPVLHRGLDCLPASCPSLSPQFLLFYKAG